MTRKKIFIFSLGLFLLAISFTAQANFIFLEGEEDWLAGDIENLVLSEDYPGALELKKVDGEYVADGIYKSPIIETTYPFASMVASWNVITPGETYVIVEADVKIADETWSGWQVMGIWGQNTESRSITLSQWNDGYPFRINIDIFQVLHEDKAQKYRLRATLISPDGKETPVLTGIAGTAYDNDEPYPSIARPEGYLREIEVPNRSQMIEDQAIRSRICSPTSMAMVLEMLGHDESTESVAYNSYDHGASIFGNWSFNVAYAGSLGYRAYVDHYPGLNEIRAKIAQGIPVITSIRYGAGQLDNAPMNSTSGHLVLVVGFTERDGKEYIVVNDPAAPDNETVRREFCPEQFENAWIGIVYIIEER